MALDVSRRVTRLFATVVVALTLHGGGGDGGSAFAARILGVFPHHGLSHHKVFLPYLHALADRGHEVHVISNFPSSHPNMTNVDVSGSMPMHNNNVTFPDSSSFDWLGKWMELHQLYQLAVSTEGMLRVPAVRRMLQQQQQQQDDASSSRPFDLVILEHFNSEMPLGFAAKFRAPFVLLSSCGLLPWTQTAIGQPLLTAYRPAVLVGMPQRMTFAERLTNTVVTHLSVAVFRAFHRSWSQRMLAQYFGLPDVSLADVAANASLVLVNTHWTINGVAPSLPAILEVGGMHLPPVKPLPKVSVRANTGARILMWYYSYKMSNNQWLNRKKSREFDRFKFFIFSFIVLTFALIFRGVHKIPVVQHTVGDVL